MMAWTTWEFRWLLIAALVLSLTVSAFRMARMAGRLGRRPWAWFFISLFFTALPATVVFWRDRAKRISAGYARKDDEPAARGTAERSRPVGGCPHCGAILDSADRAAGECPRCRMSLDTGRYA